MFKKTASRSVAGTTSIKHDTRLKLDFLAPFELNCRLLINACRTVGTWKVCRGAISNELSSSQEGGQHARDLEATLSLTPRVKQ